MDLSRFSFLSTLLAHARSALLFVRQMVWEHPKRRWGSIAGLVLLALLYLFLVAPPLRFPVGSLVKVTSGTSVGEVTAALDEAHIIRSSFVLKAVMLMMGGEKKMVAGSYLFPRRQNVLSIAWRLVTGDFDIEPVRVTIPEGANTREVAQILGQHLLGFDEEIFLSVAQEHEGFLFPDTYFFLPGEDPGVILAAMGNNFDTQVATLREEIEAFGRPLSEVIIMASLLEEEAPYLEDKQIIAGILWERIDRGIPLQVDAVFPYIIGKNSFELTREDLKVDSPYNTYLYRGLPAGAITNPGLESILAAVTPKKTDYLFYLSDYDGNFHYSISYDQHLRFKVQYLGS